MLLQSFLETSAARLPHKTALIVGDQRWSYADIDRAANRVAHRLLDAGLERGDRVAILLDNGPEAVISIFGALKAGAVFMVVNPSTKADKLRYILDNSRASTLIIDETKRRAFAERLDGAAHLKRTVAVGTSGAEPPGGPPILSWSSLSWSSLCAPRDGDGTPPRIATIPIDLAALIYTSGSTGNPKGVMLSHQNMVAASTSITTYLENVEDDVVIDVLPLAFDYGLYQVLMAFQYGGTVVLERSFTFPHHVMQRIVDEGVTGLPLVPTISAILLSLDLSKYDLSRLRYVTNTAAALPTAHIQALRERLPHVRLYSMYGLTECKRVAYLPPEQIDRRPGSVGVAMPFTEAFVIGDDGERAPPGVVGELVVRGPHVMLGYWELPDETARRLRPGRLPREAHLYTGDLFKTDEEGYLYFVGRNDDIIKSRGEKVAPREVENVLYALEGVQDAAVIGVPDPVLGQAIKAFVSLKPGSDLGEQEVLRHCARHLEDFMVPKLVELRAELPKNASGKIDKLALTAPAHEEETP